ncbi:MAG: hypothetical protein ACPGID_04435 [Rubricella sp.]
MTKMRLFSYLVLAAGAYLLYHDFRLSVFRGDNLRVREAGEVWATMHRDSLLQLQPAIERYLTPWLWDPLMLTILTTPASPMVLVLGSILWIAGSKRLRGY